MNKLCSSLLFSSLCSMSVGWVVLGFLFSNRMLVFGSPKNIKLWRRLASGHVIEFIQPEIALRTGNAGWTLQIRPISAQCTLMWKGWKSHIGQDRRIVGYGTPNRTGSFPVHHWKSLYGVWYLVLVLRQSRLFGYSDCPGEYGHATRFPFHPRFVLSAGKIKRLNCATWS